MCGYRSRASSDSSACFDGKHTDRSDWEVELLETVLLRYEIPRHKASCVILFFFSFDHTA